MSPGPHRPDYIDNVTSLMHRYTNKNEFKTDIDGDQLGTCPKREDIELAYPLDRIKGTTCILSA